MLPRPLPGKNLLDKVWDAHTVRELPSGQTQLFIGLHLIHEVTSPQAFAMLRELGLPVRFPSAPSPRSTTSSPPSPRHPPAGGRAGRGDDDGARAQLRASRHPLFDPASGKQGIVHVIGPELGLTQPGMTIACGDSHTSTHGAFGAVAFGIGTSQVRDVLATQCLAMARPKVRRIEVTGEARRPASTPRT